MRKKIFIFLITLSLLLIMPSKVGAVICDIKAENIKDGSATISWDCSSGELGYGTLKKITSTNFDKTKICSDTSYSASAVGVTDGTSSLITTFAKRSYTPSCNIHTRTQVTKKACFEDEKCYVYSVTPYKNHVISVGFCMGKGSAAGKQVCKYETPETCKPKVTTKNGVKHVSWGEGCDKKAECDFKITPLSETRSVEVHWKCTSGKVSSATIYESDKNGGVGGKAVHAGMNSGAEVTQTLDSSDLKIMGKDNTNVFYYRFSASIGSDIPTFEEFFSITVESNGTTVQGTTNATQPTGAVTTSTIESAKKRFTGSTYATRTTEAGIANICDEKLKKEIRYYWTIIMVLAPIALILLISFDFVKAVTSGKPDALQKSGVNAVKRTIAAVILLLLPYLLRIVFGWFGLDICI